jgi:hypothetical protein
VLHEHPTARRLGEQRPGSVGQDSQSRPAFERQTDESRLGPKGVYKKVAAHKRYVEVVLKKPDETQVLFACDDPAVAATAERAGRENGIYTVAGDVGRIAHHLYQSALRLS